MNRELHPVLKPLAQEMERGYPDFVGVDYGFDHIIIVGSDPPGGACPVSIVAVDTEFIFGLGQGDCRWELQYIPDDMAFARNLWRSAVRGDVVEVFAPGRSRITVTLDDGSTTRHITNTGLRGCLPIPRWTRNEARTVKYEPYPTEVVMTTDDLDVR